MIELIDVLIPVAAAAIGAGGATAILRPKLRSTRSLETDTLTGFTTQAKSIQTMMNDQVSYALPCAIVACDIERLSSINETLGREVGDQVLALLAETLRDVFPANADFVRHADATLLVISPSTSEGEGRRMMAEAAKRMKEQQKYPTTVYVQGCVEMLSNSNQDIVMVIQSALSGLRARKLLMEGSTHSSLISSLAQMQRQNDGETEDHMQRTRATGTMLGKKLGLSDHELVNLELLCLLHDMGKVGIPLEILNKPEQLTKAEWAILQSHTIKGYKIAKASEELSGIADYILHHHEHWDGTGYPDGLSHEAIPLLSRLVQVVDTFDAMTHNRTYQKAISVEQAKEELRNRAGTQFDPTVVAEFLALLDEHPEIATSEWMDDKVEASVSSQPALTNPHAALSTLEYAHYQLDENNVIIEINDVFTQLTGYTHDDLKAYNLTQDDLIPLEDRADYWAQVQAGITKTKSIMVEHRLLTKSGSTLYVMCYGRVYYDSVSKTTRSEIIAADLRNTNLAQSLVDTAQERSNRARQMWENALRKDPTGILTRNAFRDDCQTLLMDDKKTLLLMLMDIDFFKQYNDAKGHPQGDALLQAMAKLLQEAAGEDGFAGRLGGDEFAVAIPFPRESSAQVLEETAAAVWNHVNSGLIAYDSVHITLGASAISDVACAFSSLYAAADNVLYEAKESGRNCYCAEMML